MIKLKPMLASKVEIDKLKYPVSCTPKLDGIRCLMVDGVAYSRNMKRIRNKFIQDELRGLHGLDGELMVEGDFNNVQSSIMSADGEPDFTYHVFDYWDSNKGYSDRIKALEQMKLLDRVKVLLPTSIMSEERLFTFLEGCLSHPPIYEGVMIRDPNGKYKQGRSTVNEGLLLKLKKFHDDEGVLVEVVEAMINNNEQERDELGRSKRSKKKENLVPANTAGSIIIQWQGKQFSIGFGRGWNDEKKQDLWYDWILRVGDHVKFKYQELSKEGIPRFGKMIGFRDQDDM